MPRESLTADGLSQLYPEMTKPEPKSKPLMKWSKQLPGLLQIENANASYEYWKSNLRDHLEIRGRSNELPGYLAALEQFKPGEFPLHVAMFATRQPSLATEAKPASTFLGKVQEEATRARSLFPGNRLMLAALMEEVGELAQALIDNDRGKATFGDIYTEAVQVAAMALRLAEEGDASFPQYRCPFLS